MTDDEIRTLFAQQNEIIANQATALARIVEIADHLQAENDALANALVLLGALLKHRGSLQAGDLGRAFNLTAANIGERAQLAERMLALLSAWSEDAEEPPSSQN
jgi:hypothetical protein